MRKLLIIGGILGLLLTASVFGLALYIAWGPTLPVPAEDPVARLNREHADVPGNAAELYKAAAACLTGKPRRDWLTDGKWSPGLPVPAEAADWVAQNAEAIELARRATELGECWFELERGASGAVVHSSAGEQSTLAQLFLWRARIAGEREDIDEFVDSLLVMNVIARRTLQVPIIFAQVCGFACLKLAQLPVLEPYSWEGLEPKDRLAYAEHIRPLFEPPPLLVDALKFDREELAWQYANAVQPRGIMGLLFSPARFNGELHRYQQAIVELAQLPVVEQADPDGELRLRLRALARERVSRLRPVRRLAQTLTPSLEGAIDQRMHIVAVQRGNLTALELFSLYDRTGSLPATLDELDSDLKIDPYTGDPFIYRVTKRGFTLYSAGVDRDDDGGKHHPRFGKPRGWGTEPPATRDGDYVFWPLPGE